MRRARARRGRPIRLHRAAQKTAVLAMVYLAFFTVGVGSLVAYTFLDF